MFRWHTMYTHVYTQCRLCPSREGSLDRSRDRHKRQCVHMKGTRVQAPPCALENDMYFRSIWKITLSVNPEKQKSYNLYTNRTECGTQKKYDKLLQSCRRAPITCNVCLQCRPVGVVGGSLQPCTTASTRTYDMHTDVKSTQNKA
jgi:hypothetical protein